MTELPGWTFRFSYPTSDLLMPILHRLPPADREAVIQHVEPLLAKRDRDLEDAITLALGCCH